MAPPFLSDKVRDLIQKSRIVSFASWRDTYSAEAIAIFQTADDSRVYLSDADIQALQEGSDTFLGLELAQVLRDRAPEIVDEARAAVLQAFPDILEPGGGLYPPERAEACWRDFWQFLRCVTYGIAGDRPDYTSTEGLHHMNLLYQELQVPLAAMVVGLNGLKQASLRHLNSAKSALHNIQGVACCFDCLIEQLEQFS